MTVMTECLSVHAVSRSCVSYRRAEFVQTPDGLPSRLEDLIKCWRGALRGSKGDINACDRMSICQLEVDAMMSDVLNIRDVSSQRLTMENRSANKVVQSLAYIWEDLRERGKVYGLDTPEKASLSGHTRY